MMLIYNLLTMKLSREGKREPVGDQGVEASSKRTPAGPRLRIVPNLNMVNDNIPRNAVELVHNPSGDGNCGFRAIAFGLYANENRYVEVKEAMLAQFLRMTGKPDYEEFPTDRVLKVLNPADNEWFLYPYCAQIAADTFNLPIAFYGIQTHILFPYRTIPAFARQTRPMVLQLSEYHIILIKIKEDTTIHWPEVHPLRVGVVSQDFEHDPWYRIYKDSFRRMVTPFAPFPPADVIPISESDSDDGVESDSSIVDLTLI